MSIAKTCTIDDPSTEDLSVYKGDHLTYAYTLKDDAGTAVSIASASIYYTVWDIESGASQFQLICKPVTAGTWASSVVTFTVSAHGFAAGDSVTVEDCGNTSYNGTYTVVSAPTADTWTAAKGSDPGAFTTAGYCSEGGAVTMTTPASGTFSVNLTDTETDTDAKTYRYSIFVVLSDATEHHAAVGKFRILDGVYNT
jgi:hypothetical protein